LSILQEESQSEVTLGCVRYQDGSCAKLRSCREG